MTTGGRVRTGTLGFTHTGTSTPTLSAATSVGTGVTGALGSWNTVGTSADLATHLIIDPAVSINGTGTSFTAFLHVYIIWQSATGTPTIALQQRRRHPVGFLHATTLSGTPSQLIRRYGQHTTPVKARYFRLWYEILAPAGVNGVGARWGKFWGREHP